MRALRRRAFKKKGRKGEKLLKREGSKCGRNGNSDNVKWMNFGVVINVNNGFLLGVKFYNRYPRE